MNVWQLRQEFERQYKNKFSIDYDDGKIGQELKLLKGLLAKYGEDVVCLAIVYFLKHFPQNKVSLSLFASSKFFSVEFQGIINNAPLAFFMRRLLSFKPEDRKKVITLMDEYSDLSVAISLSDDEILRRKEILGELEEFKIKCNLVR